jgi:hypothetical protein
MKNSPVSEKFVKSLMENLYLGYGKNAMVGIPTLGKSPIKGLTGVSNKFEMPTGTGEGSGQDQGNQGKGSGDVTGNQENASAASKAGPANDTFSHEAEKMPAETSMNSSDPTTAGAGSKDLPDITTKWKELENVPGTGLPETIGNRWSMPKPLYDHQEEVESSDHPASEEPEASSLQERVEKLEEALTTLVNALRNQLPETE